ncbi:MAG: DUF4189 domain-containing protein [Syntrophorhabdales bacterium]
MNKWVARLIIIAAILMIKPAWGWQNCTTSCSRYIQGQCVEHTQHCTEEGTYVTPDFGAIAYGKTKKSYGTSYKWASRAKAESVALQKCSQYANDCEIAVWFRNQCGAVVTRSDNQLYYWGLGKTEGEAKSVAMKECTKNNGQKCEVLISQCASNK